MSNPEAKKRLEEMAHAAIKEYYYRDDLGSEHLETFFLAGAEAQKKIIVEALREIKAVCPGDQRSEFWADYIEENL